MGIVKLSTAGILDYQKYSSVLAGNAAFSPGSFDLLETQVLSSSASSVTFTGLGSYTDYKHLQVRGTVRCDWAYGTLHDVNIKLNSVSSSVYAFHHLYGNGSSVYSTASSTQPRMRANEVMPSATQSTGIFGAFVIDLLDFSNANKNTTLRILQGVAASGSLVGLSSGLFAQTNAVTAINLESSAGDFVTGSRFSLYGVK